MEHLSSNMRVEYDPGLIQEVVLKEIERREKDGDSNLFREYHKAADPIYEEYPIESRETQFGKLHERIFLELGFGETVNKTLDEFPELKEKADAVIVGKSFTKHDERADLSTDLKTIGIKIRTELFFDQRDLQKLLRHELMHVSDLLDKEYEYKYSERLDVSFPAEENIVRERYRILWDIYIDSRLIRSGRETVSDKDGRCREFEALYQKIPHSNRTTIFERFWKLKKLTHNQILELAFDTGRLLQRFGAIAGIDEDPEIGISGNSIQHPGSLCPLCRFPTFTWKHDINVLDEDVIKLIKKDYPHWETVKGACEQCIEGYEVRAGKWSPNV
jgi:hypothetical protein